MSTGLLADNHLRPQPACMAAATIRLYGCLNDFLPSARRGADAVVTFVSTSTARDLVESLGPPHVEVELVVIDGRVGTLDDVVTNGARLAAYPAFHGLPVEVQRPELRFVLDGHLGTLARNLRLLGFDAAYDHRADDPALASIAERERRILLSRELGS